jgi:ABC-type nickel/cobalt efflux system permease component RcnA
VTSRDQNFMLMLVLGVLSIVFRRTLVRWANEMRYGIFRLPKPDPRRQRELEILQLVVGVILVLFGVVGLIYLR